MKKLLIVLAFLFSIGIAEATVYNCTAVGQQIVVPDCVCTMPECPECPILPNETIIIQNLTMPEPNLTCNYDLSWVGNFSEKYLENIQKARNELTACQNEKRDYEKCDKDRIDLGNQLIQKDEEFEETLVTWQQYCVGTFALGVGIMWYYYSRKLKPAGSSLVMDR